MKQVFNKKGKVVLDDVPSPAISDNEILVKVFYSCISTGTELSNLKSSGKSLIRRAVENPENYKKVLSMISERGIKNTLGKVKEKAEDILPVGYSASGVVADAGKEMRDFKIGDEVACAGAGLANHAEYIAVPENLIVKIPENLSLMEASTVALGGISLQGIRRADMQIGEYAVVYGLGILGQISAQLLKVSGCRVIGMDVNQERIDTAALHGLNFGLNCAAKDVVEEVMKITDGHGADSVIITASSAGDEIINKAVEMCRRKGRVIIVGDISLNLKRESFYKKELDIMMSTSYGPGRYDEKYELKGCEYPYAYIRWTENRNMRQYLDLLAERKIAIKELIGRIFKVEEVEKAYDYLNSKARPLVVLIEYNKESEEVSPERKLITGDYKLDKNLINVGIIGAGNFSREVHLPNLLKLNNLYRISALCNKVGFDIKNLAKKYSAAYITTDYKEILKDKNIDMVIISTRHNLHASIAMEAIGEGKAVFMEKPMAMNFDELRRLVLVLEKHKVPFMVGFNRRFSPLVIRIKKLISDRTSPVMIDYQMNAGYIPLDNWVFGSEGGGRNIGEACHIYDLFNYLIGEEIESIQAAALNPETEYYSHTDNFSVTLKYKDGSVCNFIYTSLGNKNAPKEIIHIYFDNKIIQLNDYKDLVIYGGTIQNIKLKLQDKGHYNELESYAKSIIEKNNINPIPLWQLIQATETSFKVEELLKIR